MKAERLTGVVTDHGEGAGWDGKAGTFRLVDMLAGDLVTISDGGVVARQHVGSVAAAWRPRANGGLVVAVERGFSLLGPSGSADWSTEVWSDPSVRMNEGACDPQGRFYCGSMRYDKGSGGGTLWRLDPDRSVHRVLDGLTIANGMVWSLDGDTVFHIDTPSSRIDRYDFDASAGTLHGRRTFAEVSGGGPDGMAMDAEGGLWVAIWGGHAVHRYGPDGTLTQIVEVGADQVTSCAFGGPNLSTLLITTSRYELGEQADRNAGAIFVVEPGVQGAPLHEFAG